METVSDSWFASMSIAVADDSQIGEARRVAKALAEACAMDESTSGRVALIASEAATNLVRHGGGGHVLLRRLTSGRTGIEMLAVDRGAGIRDLGIALRDGYSSIGTRGAGLGAMARASSFFDVLSAPAAGTIVLSQVWGDGARAKAPAVEFGAVCLPIAGERLCGDDWAVTEVDHKIRLFVADGLGHGPAAHDASADATRVFTEVADPSPGRALERVHLALRGGRGAAVAAAFLDPERGSIEFAGVGNIAGVVRSEAESRSMVSHSGTAGHVARRFHDFSYEWPANSVVVLHSDGLTSHWTLNAFPGLLRRHPSLIAAALHRDFSRGRDDVTVVVARRGRELVA